MFSELGLQHISELFATNGGWAQLCRNGVPDNGDCDVETPPAGLSPGPRNQHSKVNRSSFTTGDEYELRSHEAAEI